MYLVRKIDRFLNGITMYRLLLYGLGTIAAVAVLFGFTGTLSLSGTSMLVSVVILLATCFATNFLLGRLYDAPLNSESSLITAMILFCIMPPPKHWIDALALCLAGIIAMASKFVLAIRHKHIFNPAAVGALVVGSLNLLYPTWWIGSDVLLPFSLLFGLLLLRKTRRFSLFISFVTAALSILLIIGLRDGNPVTQILRDAFVSWPLIFFGTVMLTEPLTTPSTRNLRIMYGLLAGTLFASQAHIGSYYMTPALALVLSNIFSYLVSTKHRLKLTLKEKRQMSPKLFDFVFEPDRPLQFKAGQYLEWTMPHMHADGRGNRRTFTIASSPTESKIHLGVKFYEPASNFKQALKAMEPGDTLEAGQLAGDFTLPKDMARKLVFVAGGIGVTPFRSMLKYIIDSQEKRDVAVFYIVSDSAELVYKDILREAQAQGIKIIPVLSSKEPNPSWKGHTGLLSEELLNAEVPDYKTRLFYISGPDAMVRSYEKLLHQAGVGRRGIVTDYFSGY